MHSAWILHQAQCVDEVASKFWANLSRILFLELSLYLLVFLFRGHIAICSFIRRS